MQIHLVAASEKDAQLIAHLAEQIWKDYYPSIIGDRQVEYMLNKFYSKLALLEQMKNKQQFYLIYEDDNPLGYISVTQQGDKEYFLNKFYIDTKMHNKGIGSEAFELLFRTLNSPDKISLTVNRQNYKAINFYFRNGFIIEKVADFDIGQGFVMNDFVMTRQSK